jgi:hypothetical protein
MAVSDDFVVNLNEVMTASETFVGQQGVPERLSGSFQGAATVDTGDPGLDSQIRAVAEQFAALLSLMSQAVQYGADGLSETAQGYWDTDQSVVDRFDRIGQQGSEGSAPTEGTPMASGPSIADKMSGVA